MPIVPDTKDWTWVLDRACPKCGFDTALPERTEVGALIRANAAAWTALLRDRDDGWWRSRPRPDVWSPLEYACHVRDVYELFGRRLAMMLREDDPRFPSWDQDATAVESAYGAQSPPDVVAGLAAHATALAAEFDALGPRQWERRGMRSDGARFTVDSFARYLLHDVVHHVADVTG
jgi:hypothetical protein